MDLSQRPETSKPLSSQNSVKQKLRDVQTPGRTQESLTVLSEVAYPGPSKEDLAMLNTPNSAELL